MANNKNGNSKKKGTTKKTAVGTGVALVAATAIGAYMLYGSKGAEKRRKQVRSWMLKAKGEVLDKLEKAKEVNESAYFNIVDTVAKKYAAISNVDRRELTEMADELKDHWRNIKAQLGEGNKKAAKRKPAKKANKK
jgi:hypothetical protein